MEGFVFADLGLGEAGAGTDDVDFEFLEIGEDGDGNATGKGIALGLVDVAGVKGFGRFLGLAGEALDAGDAEYVVGSRLATGEGGAHLDVHLALGVDEAFCVAHVPAESTEERVEEIGAHHRLVVIGVGEVGVLAIKAGDKAG